MRPHTRPPFGGVAHSLARRSSIVFAYMPPSAGVVSQSGLKITAVSRNFFTQPSRLNEFNVRARNRHTTYGVRVTGACAVNLKLNLKNTRFRTRTKHRGLRR